MMTLHQRLDVERLGHRGEGIARGPAGVVYVPYALSGETIVAEVDGERGRLGEILVPSPDRITPFCPHYTVCGGCAVQALAPHAYAQWKRGIVVAALRGARLQAEVDALQDAHGTGRRRATFHARNRGRNVAVGFMQARAHEIIDLDACPILAPEMEHALEAAHAAAYTLRGLEKPLDIGVTATLSGLDIDLRGAGKLEDGLKKKLVALAETHDLARIANHGDMVALRRLPVVKMGLATVAIPSGGFLQATLAAEDCLAAPVLAATNGVTRVADLFSGVGTFALRLAAQCEVHAVEFDVAALNALGAAHRATVGLRGVTTERRNLFERPLLADELKPYGAVVFDPPRAGAEAQAHALAAAQVPLVLAVSCNPVTFARDAKILVDGGYKLEQVVPVDQFKYSPHVEIVATFRRPAIKKKARLLG